MNAIGIINERKSLPIARLDLATAEIGPSGARRRIINAAAIALISSRAGAKRDVAREVIEAIEEAGFQIVKREAPR